MWCNTSQVFSMTGLTNLTVSELREPQQLQQLTTLQNLKASAEWQLWILDPHVPTWTCKHIQDSAAVVLYSALDLSILRMCHLDAALK
jgi:hypothetical protein